MPGEHGNTFRQLMDTPLFEYNSTTKIVSFDEVWTKELIRKGILLPLNGIDPNFNLRDYFLKGKGHQSIEKEPNVAEIKRIYGVPFYLNFGVLCYRRDLINKHRETIEAELRINPESLLDHFRAEDLTWDRLVKIAEVIKEEENDDNLIPFDFDTHLEIESLSTTFLEIFWHYIVKVKKNDDGLEIRLDEEDKTDLKTAINTLKNASVLKSHPSHREAIFRREWYTTYRDLSLSDL